MKKFNTKKSILEKGGMMVEALAMLGLMAVVTPTMYKKSAERTLEVEDINTATTVRTYMNAANSLMSTNYVTIVKDMEENHQDVKQIDIAGGELDAFLPYNFQVDHSLYEYNTPKISIVRNGTNLTAFALFPARATNEDDSIGQERTARIASLVGANGGYVRSANSARGVGGIWSLEGADYAKVFPSDSSPVYSLVASTSNAVNGSTQAGDLDNSKYLQRTYEGDEEKWRNAMRTDLYMGGYNDGDEHPLDTPEGVHMHSIRNIDTLIVGAETQPNGKTNGLYIAPSATNKDAFIGGKLAAAEEAFLTNTNILGYAKKSGSKVLNVGGDYLFQVNTSGDLNQYGNVSLAEGFASDAYNGEVYIGGRNGTGKDYALSATHSGGATKLSLVREHMFNISTSGLSGYAYSDEMTYDTNETNGNVQIMRGGYNKVNKGGIKSTIGTIQYNTAQAFPVAIGANTRVRGLLAADQIDTNNLRTANLKTGSEKVDDQYQWLEVDKDGVKMHDITRQTNGTPKVKMDIDNSGIAMRVGGYSDADNDAAVLQVGKTSDYDDKAIAASAKYINLRSKDVSYMNDGHILISNAGIKEQIKANEFSFDRYSDDYSNFRVLIGSQGNLDLADANFRVVRNGQNVVTIAGNDRYEENIYKYPASYGSFRDDMVNGIRSNHYDMGIHGNVIFTEQNNSNPYKYMSIGRHDETAGVNINTINTNSDSNAMFVDLTSKNAANEILAIYDKTNQKFYDNGRAIDPGTVYIRKGSVSVAPRQPSSDVGGSGGMSAKTSTGSIQAGRFVANNLDSSGNYVTVPKVLTDNVYNKYNGTSTTRYDTYMVNPAYTSVMHDIKLTTRGGARLSDVLPDFITKGIYIANNNKDDNITNFTFSYSGVAGGNVGGASVLTSSGVDWASPYTGSVPTPQCPPGYMRVITVSPLSMNIAQAGNLSYTDPAHSGQNAGPNYLVEEALMATTASANAMKSSSDTDLKEKVLPQYRQLSIGDAYSDYHARMQFAGYSDEIVVENIDYMTARATTSDGSPINYVLTAQSASNTLKPFVFQQNTWLKALTVPLCSSGTTEVGQNCGNQYTRAWAILLGFVYPTSIYDDYLSTSGSKRVSSGSSLAWNVFPVVKDSLEATVTTYCYFNRSNLGAEGEEPFVSGYGKYVDEYHPLLSDVPTSFRKDASEAYINRLNDPNLNYNEVW